MREPRTAGRRTAVWVGGLVLIAAGIATFVLERRAADRERQVQRWVEEEAGDPVATVVTAARGRRIVLLGDVIGAPAPKRLAAAIIDSLAHTGGLDIVALEVPSDQQTWIDLYLESNPEDATVLLAHPAVLRREESNDRALLDIYRTIWRINHELGADRRIRILAIDSPDWPPAPGTSPARALASFGGRDSIMTEVLVRRVIERDPRARMLVFVDGVRVAGGGARITASGAPPFDVTWLGERLRSYAPREVLSVLVDARPGPGAMRPVAGHQTGWLYDVIRTRTQIPRTGIGLRVWPELDVDGDELGESGGPGVRVESVPDGARVFELIDVYVLLPS